MGVADHLGDSTIRVLEEDGDGPKLIIGVDVHGWVFGPARGEFKTEVREDPVLPEGGEDFIIGPRSVEGIPFLVGRDYLFLRCGGPPDGDTRDGDL